VTAEKKPNNTKSSAKSKTSNNKKSKKISKGNFGYFKSEKKRRLIITAILFAVPLFIFFTSWIYFKTRMTVWTVVAVVGCLPACKSMVSLIMILKCRPMDAGLYQKIQEHQGSLDMAYELYMTFYEKSAYIDAVAVCGNTVAAYSRPEDRCLFHGNQFPKNYPQKRLQSHSKDFHRPSPISGTP